MNKLNADALLQEAFDVLTPHGGGSSDEANRKIALREKIGRYLGAQGKPVAGSGAGGPATFCASLNTSPSTYDPGIRFEGAGGGGSGERGYPFLRSNLMIVKLDDGSEYTMSLPSDMPETGIHLDVNGKSRTVTRAELQKMIDDGDLKL